MEISTISIGLAFLAGLASFLSPCVFSLIPAYIGYLGGISIQQDVAAKKDIRIETLKHGLAFVLGFSVVFVSLGIAASALGGLLFTMSDWISKIGGIVVIIFGVHLTGLYRIKFLDFDMRHQTASDTKRSFITSALMGVFFSAGWSPCVGPVLGAILTIAFNGGSVLLGIKLLSTYSLGMAIPFLFAAIGIGWVTLILKKYGRVIHFIEVLMGILLIIVGTMLFFGTFETLNRFGFFVDFGL